MEDLEGQLEARRQEILQQTPEQAQLERLNDRWDQYDIEAQDRAFDVAGRTADWQDNPLYEQPQGAQ